MPFTIVRKGGIVHVQYEVFNPPPFFQVIDILFPNACCNLNTTVRLTESFHLEPVNFSCFVGMSTNTLVYF